MFTPLYNTKIIYGCIKKEVEHLVSLGIFKHANDYKWVFCPIKSKNESCAISEQLPGLKYSVKL